MSFLVREDRCIGCGACDFSCHTDALTKTDTFFGLFQIDPYLCDDCAVCVGKCPEGAIVADERFPVCNGHGCPLHSERLAGTECAVWQQTCDTCGTTLWMEPDADHYQCPKCDSHRKVSCPKTRLMVTIPSPTLKAKAQAH